ncbi:MAG: hypothetical protein JSV18_06110 [Candidatus Bathyarchaeota archaeon]|nr:MAG: hypothetical protein JSV18_06110 [Candidatus Bathyarchaeota archaeon]
MTCSFLMSLDEIQPSQLYISREKLSQIREAFRKGDTDSLEPIPIKELNGEIVSTDGHTRGLAWYLNGFSLVEVEWEDTELDWEAYEICVAWCKEEGILSIADLEDRIIGPSEYQTLWLDRCRKMQEELAAKRGEASKKPSS